MRNWLKRLRAHTPNARIFRAALLTGFCLLLTKLATTFKELVVARQFGRSDELDAFLIAYLVPSFVVMVAVGALSSALIPAFVSVRETEGPQAAQKLFSSSVLISMLLLSGVSVLLGISAPYFLPLLGSSFSPAKLLLTRELLYLLLPFIFFNGLATCAGAVLNASEKFTVPALAPVLTPLLTIPLVLFTGARWGTFALATGVVAGSILEASLVVWALHAAGTRLAFRWYGLTPHMHSVLSQYVPMLAGCFLAGGTTVVDQSMAAVLESGSVAALGYANRIVTALTTLGVTALGTAVLPYFSQMVASEDWEACRHTLKRYTALVLAVSVPVTAALVIFARPLVALLFQRGAFTSSDTALVSRVEIYYALQVPFFIWSTLFVRLLSAMRYNKVLLYSAAISLALDIVLNLILMKFMGVAGIALSTSLVFVFTVLFLGVWSMKLLGQRLRLQKSDMPTVERPALIS